MSKKYLLSFFITKNGLILCFTYGIFVLQNINQCVILFILFKAKWLLINYCWCNSSKMFTSLWKFAWYCYMPVSIFCLHEKQTLTSFHFYQLHVNKHLCISYIMTWNTHSWYSTNDLPGKHPTPLLLQDLLTSPAVAALNPRNDSRADGSLQTDQICTQNDYIKRTFKTRTVCE